MKFIISAIDGNLPAHKIGWVRALGYYGHQCGCWPSNHVPIYDLMDEAQPDVIIALSQDVTPAFVARAKESPELRIFVEGKIWGDIDESIEPEDSSLLASQEEKNRIAALSSVTKYKPVVLTHYCSEGITHNKWNSVGAEVFSMPLAADTFDFYGDEVSNFDPLMSTDVCFVGGYHPHKQERLHKFLLSLPDNYKIKVFGHTLWPVPNYVGYLDTHRVKNAFASAKICPNISAPTCVKYGVDVNERVFKIIASGGFAVSDHVGGLEQLFPSDEIPLYNDPHELEELISRYCDPANANERHSLMQMQRLAVMSRHTYQYRIQSMMEFLRCKK